MPLNDPKEVTLYQDEGLVRVPLREMLQKLRDHGYFAVALEFVDPVTGSLVQDLFPFYPKSVVTFAPGGRAFMTRHREMIIRLPADPEWWWRMQKGRGQVPAEVPQKTTILKEGEIVNVSFTVEVIGSAIRLPGQQVWRGILAKQAA